MGQHTVIRDTKEVNSLCSKYYGLSEDEIRELCAKAGKGLQRQMDVKPSGLLRRLLNLLESILGRTSIAPLILEHVSLAVEAFALAPADLPEKSRLYQHQVQAAIALTQRSLIQMDTGEGKTYALLPAAFALACRHHRVYIVCANEYLAWRDANRTRRYWDFVGMPVGLGISSTDKSEWHGRIIYTTLEQVIFQALTSEIARSPDPNPIMYNAMIMDEADAILLDQGEQQFRVVKALRARTFDWEKSIQVAKNLMEDQHIIVDRATLTANLTTEGEDSLREYLGLESKASSAFFLMRHTVEHAFVATQVVAEDIDYIEENGKIHPIDRLSGIIKRGHTPYWLMPLEFERGFGSRQRHIDLHRATPEVFLSEFEHLSGLSGTIQEDSLEYFVGYGLPTVVIPPRKQRQHGLKEDLFFGTRRVAQQAAYELALEASGQGRPVVIGTQNIADAEEIFNLFQHHAPQAKARLISGKNERDIAEVFRQAGNTDSVIITTQLAGRGVDIRLSDEARENGGLFLLSLGRARNRRYDRQFLGRAGRQGDPWTARFVISMEDPLMQIFGSERIANMMKTVGMQENDVIESKMVSTVLRNAQQKLRTLDFWKRRTRSHLGLALLNIRPQIKNWFEQVRCIDELEYGGEDQALASADFCRWLTDRYIAVNFTSLLHGRADITHEVAKVIYVQLASALNIDIDDLILELDFEGRSGDLAIQVIQTWLYQRLTTHLEKYSLLNQRSYQTLASIRPRLRDLSTDVQSLHRQFKKILPYSRLYPQTLLSLASPTQGETETDAMLISGVHVQGPPAHVLENAQDILREIDGLKELLAGISGHSNQDRSDEVAALTSHIEKTLLSLRELDDDWANSALLYKHSARTAKSISYWTIQLEWIAFLEGQDRTIHRVFQNSYSTMESYRLIYDGLLADWEKRDADLPEKIVKNLFQVENPSSLDDLFLLEDNSEKAEIRESPPVYQWTRDEGVKLRLEEDKQRDSVTDSIIGPFITQAELEDSAYFSIDSLRQLLNDFLRETPINILQTPVRIQTAIERWFVRENNMGLTSKRKRLNRRWVRRFLLYLNQRNLIGPLPTFRHKVGSVFSRFSKAMLEAKTALSVIGSIVFAVAFFFLSMVQTGKLMDFSSYGVLIHTAVFGGMLQYGIFTAPAFAALVVSQMLVSLLNMGGSGQIKGVGMDKHFALVLQICFAWLIIEWNWSSSSWPEITSSMAVFLLAIVFARLTQNVSWNIENTIGLSLSGVWLCYTMLLLGLMLVASATGFWSAAALAIGLIAVHTAWHLLNGKELTMVSIRIKDVHMQREDVSTSVRVVGNCGIAPHIYSLLLSISCFELCGVIFDRYYSTQLTQLYLQVVAAGTYFTTFIFLHNLVLAKRFSSSLWQQRLNRKYQVIKGLEKKEKRDLFLSKLRSKFMYREIFASTIMIGSAMWLLWDIEEPNTGYPLALLLIFITRIFSHYIRNFFIQVYKVIFSRGPMEHEMLDFSQVEEDIKASSIWERTQHILSNRIGVILALLAIVIQALTLMLNGWELFRNIGAQ